MTHFDVFNGDADGLCALRQLRLDQPRDAILVTGVKRDNALLARVDARAGDSVTVLDLSLAVNRAALDALLARDVAVEYFDHHFAGAMPSHPRFAAHIDTAPGVCTGILVDRHLEGRHRVWAVVAAFGDNLDEPARRLAASLALPPARVDELSALGDALAYNAYGDIEADLVVAPAMLYRLLARHADPFSFVHDEPAFRRIGETRADDLARARRIKPRWTTAAGPVYVLPDAAWSRRVRGALGNELARARRDLAHAIVTPSADGDYVASVRAPLAAPDGADALCREFATGGGRAAAAGINRLPESDLPRFVQAFERAFAPR